MRAPSTKSGKNRGENINLRVSRGQKSLIDRAASALGRSRSDFMLETACREAESVLLERRYFALRKRSSGVSFPFSTSPQRVTHGWHDF
jgi:uncharacterized protein (DUF1778 family)